MNEIVKEVAEEEVFWLDSWNVTNRTEAISAITIMISPLLLAFFFSQCVLNGAIFLIPLVICFVVFIVASFFFLTKKVK